MRQCDPQKFTVLRTPNPTDRWIAPPADEMAAMIHERAGDGSCPPDQD
jgi:hypothetical protein